MPLIYLVDDDDDDRFLLREAILAVETDATILEAMNGLDLLEKLIQSANQQVALVLLDMNMPKMNGLETISHLNSMTGFEAVPLVMVTTSAHDTIKEKALTAGCEMFKIKPNTFDGLVTFARELKGKYF